MTKDKQHREDDWGFDLLRVLDLNDLIFLYDGDKQSGVSCGSLPAAYWLRVGRHLHATAWSKQTIKLNADAPSLLIDLIFQEFHTFTFLLALASTPHKRF